MLYIKELGGSAVSESEWHVGEPMPFIGASCRVISFQADGDELVLILDAMKAASKEPVRVITIEEAKQISDGFASEVAPSELSLLDVIDPTSSGIDMTNYCSSTQYQDWEIKIAIPALKAKGYRIDEICFHNLDCDSFGPLARGIMVTNISTGVQSMCWYG